MSLTFVWLCLSVFRPVLKLWKVWVSNSLSKNSVKNLVLGKYFRSGFTFFRKMNYFSSMCFKRFIASIYVQYMFNNSKQYFSFKLQKLVFNILKVLTINGNCFQCMFQCNVPMRDLRQNMSGQPSHVICVNAFIWRNG